MNDRIYACHLWSALVLVFVAACRPPAPASSDPPSPPPTLDLAPEFAGSPVRVATLDGGIVVEILAEGEGERATTGKLVVFDYDGYQADTGEPLVVLRKRLVVGEAVGNQLDAALQLIMSDQRAGARARVFVPGTFVDATKPTRAPAIGDVWLTVVVEQVREYPKIVTLEAFAAQPLTTEILDQGIEIHDYAQGQGPAAVDGDLVEFVMIAGTVDGDVLVHNPNKVAHSQTVGSSADGFPREFLAGARVGMLRAMAMPRADARAGGDGLLDEEAVFYYQITAINPK